MQVIAANTDSPPGRALRFDDPRWAEMRGGLRRKYDPRPALRKLEEGQLSAAWMELWNELQRDGDVGEASYAAVPHLVRIGKQVCPDNWMLYALVAIVEKCRVEKDNPPLPDWLRAGYEKAWRDIGDMALARIAEARDETLISALFEVIALFKKQYALARFADLDEEERRTALAELGLS
jgi:hypothetical protein